MWYEKPLIVGLFNFIIFIIMFGILFYSFGFKDYRPYAIIVLLLGAQIYNGVWIYNTTIDKTVMSLGKYYADAIKKEIEQTIKKLKEM